MDLVVFLFRALCVRSTLRIAATPVVGVDDFASMREVVTTPLPAPARRNKDGKRKVHAQPVVAHRRGLGQLHAARNRSKPRKSSINPWRQSPKREEIIYVYGQEDDPIVLDHHSLVLHLVQMIRDESPSLRRNLPPQAPPDPTGPPN